MPKRWSKLKKQVESLFDKKLPLQVHCTDMNRAIEARTFNADQPISLQGSGNYRFVLNQEDIWVFPNEFIKSGDPESWPDGRPHSYTASEINVVVREYLNTPLCELPEQEYANDIFKVTDILKAADRRISIHKLKRYFCGTHHPAVALIIDARESSP